MSFSHSDKSANTEPNLLVINLDDLHVEAVDGGEDVGCPLHHDLPVLRHGEGGAPGHEDRLVTGHERQVRVEVALHQDHLLVPEPHLSPRVPRHVDPTQEDLLFGFRALW